MVKEKLRVFCHLNLFYISNMNIPQLPVDHPWYKLSSVALPNVKWCEETLHGWVTEPANTWSNIPFILEKKPLDLCCRYRQAQLLKTPHKIN